MDDLVKATEVARHGIYTDYQGKKGLFLACLKRYDEDIVTPAFRHVEATGAALAEVDAFYKYQLSQVQDNGLPGPGCLIANTMTELAPHDGEIRDIIEAHRARLQAGFINALTNETNGAAAPRDIEEIAQTMVIFTQGLWSASRTSVDAKTLITSAEIFLRAVKAGFSS